MPSVCNWVYVWAVDPARGVAEVREVTPGDARVDGWIAIREGLKPGDRLIAGDVSMLHPGHRVKVVGEAEVPVAAAAPPDHAEGGTRGAH
jgi:multidrug efflux pump subunit AcrA (membrane-fusion protein)